MGLPTIYQHIGGGGRQDVPESVGAGARAEASRQRRLCGMSDVTAPQATPDAAAGHDDYASTPHVVTSRYATVREAADVLGVSTETIRRMIRAGKLRAERVHRPQGTAFLVELPDATGHAAEDATDTAPSGRHNAAPEPALPPALLAAEAWARGVVEPLTRTIAEQQAQFSAQAETIGSLRAELAAVRAAETPVAAPQTPPPAEVATEAPEPVPWPYGPQLPSAPWWWRYWPSLLAAGAVLLIVAVLTGPW